MCLALDRRLGVLGFFLTAGVLTGAGSVGKAIVAVAISGGVTGTVSEEVVPGSRPSVIPFAFLATKR
jgi:hypothetical protein